MIKFLDLNTGYSFDGLWNEEQTKGYIFWFPSEQSINVTYTMPICIISDEDLGEITITVDDNDVFSLVSNSGVHDIADGFEFDMPEFSNTINISSKLIGNNYAYFFNVAAKSIDEAEFICRINIGNFGYIRVGADFYGEYEPTYINLSNFGVEIPETIQKAIYDTNVHEDFKDNILINRKFKELLSNYWDIVANKGSYKSLKNSLDWFEWGDDLKMTEIWKTTNGGKAFFSDHDIMSIFDEKMTYHFGNYSKTTYIALYYSLFKENDNYDLEMNPELSAAVLDWSKEDLMLKLSLLSQFFGTFFLPIHMSILQAAVEAQVFTNTIKAVCGASIKRDDVFGDFEYVESNIKDDAVFKMTNVRTQITDNTAYGIGYRVDTTHNTDDGPIEVSFGVDRFMDPANITEENVERFAKYYYTGPGVIIPIEMTINNQRNKDFIKHTIVDLLYNNETQRIDLYDVIYAKKSAFTIKFKYLAKQAANYEMRFTFFTGSGKTITRVIKFVVEDADNLNINIYRVCAKDDSNGFTYNDFNDTAAMEYFFKIQPNDNKSTYYMQHLPYMKPDNALYNNYKGIKLNRTVIFDVLNKNGKSHKYNEHELATIRGIMDNDFLEFDRRKIETEVNSDGVTVAKLDENGKVILGELAYMIFVSKHFYSELDDSLKKYNIIRNDLGFYPQFHNLMLMNGKSLADYTVSQYDAICCAAEVNTLDGIERFKYGHMINTAEWTFTNASDNSVVYHPGSSRVPFIADTENAMPSGYYNISFKYSLTNGVEDECRLDSGFRVQIV